MKKLFSIRSLILFSLLNLCLQSYSQSLYRRFLLGGQYDLNFSSYKTSFKSSTNSFDYSKYRTFGISPQVGYFIYKNLPIGFEVLYSFSKSSDESSIIHSSSVIVQPFIRYYIGSAKIKPYVHLSAGPGWQKTGTANFGWPETIQKTKLFKYQLRGGLGVFCNDYISFDFSFGYRSLTTFFKEPMDNGTYNEWKVLNKGIDAAIGIVVFL